jgi:hypothetical protein
MANLKALVISNGVTRQILDADSLVVGSGIASGATATGLGITAGAGNITLTATAGNVDVTSPTIISNTAQVTGLLNADGGIDRTTAAPLNIGATTATSVVLGAAGIPTTVAGNLTVQGTETVVGATVFDSTVTVGDGVGGPDTLDFNSVTGRLGSVTNPNVLWLQGENHTFSVDASTTLNAPGGNLTIESGNGNGTGAGGNLLLDAGTGTPNGIVDVGTTNASAIAIGHGAITTTVTGGLTQSGGAVSLTGNAASSFTTTTGLLTIGGAGGVSLNGSAPALVVNGAGTTLTIQTGATLTTTGTGMINLPQNFEVNSIATAYATPGTGQVTATNLNTLTAGPASDASSLHTHTGLTASSLSFTATSGSALVVGDLVSVENVAGSPEVFPSNAAGITQLQNCIGMCNTATGAAGNPVSVVTNGDVAVPDAVWDTVPLVTDVGQRAYVSETTAGHWTLTPPSATGSAILRVGIVTTGGSGAVKVSIQIGDPTIL